jgi:tetratricopeptide (TPR) repeat protein
VTRPKPNTVTGYSTRQVASLLGLSVSRVRYFVRNGVVKPKRGPRRELVFTFQHLVLLRTARKLLDSGVPLRRVSHALARLPEQLPRGRSVTAARISAIGGQVVVQVGPLCWDPLTRQGFLDLEVSEERSTTAPLAPRLVAAGAVLPELDADSWFELGCQLEATAPEEARAAYRRALEIDPDHGDALLNLGRLFHEQGDAVAAEWYYRRALTLGSAGALATFNLGVALEDQGRLEEAMEAYSRAITLDRGNADAYYNLAGVCERLGRRKEALRYLREYRALTLPETE